MNAAMSFSTEKLSSALDAVSLKIIITNRLKQKTWHPVAYLHSYQHFL
jgi:hypothetical protein